MKKLVNFDFGAWTFFSLIGVSVSVMTAGLIPRIVHASPHGMPGQGPWSASNDPHQWENDYEYRFDQLPMGGDTGSHVPWSDTYWPSYQAGIAARWNLPGSNGFKYKLLSESQVRSMTQNQLAVLSPAEKYDIFMGRFDYPTVRMVRANTSPSAQSWEGICHGWSPAALNHPEPEPQVATGPSGIAVPFGSDDIKALLDQYYANHENATEFLGAKCNKRTGSGGLWTWLRGAFSSAKACDDVNAGAFHIILANSLGIHHKGFVADVTRYGQVWNQPVFAFSSRVVGYRRPSPTAAPSAVREVLVHTAITYANEITPSWTPVVGTPAFSKGTKQYDYSLEIDAAGRIVGGEYYLRNNPDRPDFLWNAPRLEFTGYYAGINQLAKSW